ncbi:MAG: hypothetical protein PHD95_03165 [Candidatus ainarchaeum sp.]|nr:hypothetical protein [Candidatus ainarchaeum sp.]
MVLKEAKLKDEAELESILVKNPEQIEDGFKVLTHQKKAHGQDRMDILGIDSQKVLTLVELKVAVDSGQLMQALSYYDWIMEQGLDWIKEAYKTDIEDTMPQIFLIAPDFDESMVMQARFIRDDIKIRLFRYLCLEVNSQKEIKLLEQELSRIKLIEEKPKTKDELINKSSEQNIKELIKKAMADIKSLNDSVEETQSNWVFKYWIAGRKFCELEPKRKLFRAWYKTEDPEENWMKDDIITKEQWETIFFQKIKKAFDLMKNRQL